MHANLIGNIRNEYDEKFIVLPEEESWLIDTKKMKPKENLSFCFSQEIAYQKES